MRRGKNYKKKKKGRKKEWGYKEALRKGTGRCWGSEEGRWGGAEQKGRT